MQGRWTRKVFLSWQLCYTDFQSLELLHQISVFVPISYPVPLEICTGERTFGVLTKLDLMDKGTNALDVSTLSYLTHELYLFLNT